MIPLELVTQKLTCLRWLFTEDDYSLSFEESVTEDESLKEGRHSDSHRRDAKRRKNNKPPLSEDSKHLFLHFFLLLATDFQASSVLQSERCRNTTSAAPVTSIRATKVATEEG